MMDAEGTPPLRGKFEIAPRLFKQHKGAVDIGVDEGCCGID